MEEGADEVEQHLTQLCDFWWFEHLLVVPGVEQDVINFFGGLFPFREVERCSLPAPISARLFLRHIKQNSSQFLQEPEEYQPGEIWDRSREELLQVLGLLHRLSFKQQQFRRPAAAVAVRPPAELVTEVVTHVLTAWLGGKHPLSFDDEQPLAVTSDNIAYAAEQLVLEAELEVMLQDELLQNRVSLLQQLLGSKLAPGRLQHHIQQAFPVEALEVQLEEFADKALKALGPTTLQMHQKLLETQQLPPDPLQLFAARQLCSTQGVEAAEAEELAAPPSRTVSKPRRKAAELVSLLGEATAPFDAPADMQQQADELAGAPGDDSVLEDSQPVKAKGGHKRRDGKTQQALPARRSRHQLQLEPTRSGAGRVAAAAAGDGDAAAAGGTTVTEVAAGDEAAEEEAAAASMPKAGRRGRKSRKQKPPEQADAAGDAQAAGDANLPAAEVEATEAGSGGRKRRIRQAPPAADAAASEPPTAAAAAAERGDAGKGSKSLAGAFMDALSRPLTVAAGSLAAAVLRSPAEPATKDRKLCGAPADGAKGKSVLWDSPLGGSVDSPQDEASPVPKQAGRGRKPAAAPVAAAAGGPISKALKRKRAQKAQTQKPPRGRGRGADSSNTEYEDAREDAAVLSDVEGLPGGRRVGRGRRTQPEPDPAVDEWLPHGLEDSTDDSMGGVQQKKHHTQQRPANNAAAAASDDADSDGDGGAARGFVTAAMRRDEPKRRRKTVRWSEEEEELLMELVAEFGEGQWALIHKKGQGGFHIARTQVDLKDKWRNLTRFK